MTGELTGNRRHIRRDQPSPIGFKTIVQRSETRIAIKCNSSDGEIELHATNINQSTELMYSPLSSFSLYSRSDVNNRTWQGRVHWLNMANKHCRIRLIPVVQQELREFGGMPEKLREQIFEIFGNRDLFRNNQGIPEKVTYSGIIAFSGLSELFQKQVTYSGKTQLFRNNFCPILRP
jgi:hypothetical protein